MKLLPRALSGLLLLAVLGGCGQTGDLYLPGAPPGPPEDAAAGRN